MTNSDQQKKRIQQKIRLEFGKKVRDYRHANGMTIEQLAEAADLHHNYVASVERGERNLGLQNIVIIAEALGRSPKDLMPD